MRLGVDGNASQACGCSSAYFRSAEKKSLQISGLSEKLMQLIIQLRADARASKNFRAGRFNPQRIDERSESRLEDRAGETTWRSE